MTLVNQRVADEVATLLARHRYSVADSRDAVKTAEETSSRRNAEIKENAAQRQLEITARSEEARSQAEKPRNGWGNQPRQESNEISFGDEYDDYEESAPQSVRPAPAPPPAAPAPPPTPPKPAPRRPVFDEDDDFENESWLR